jgi:uncharacterized membrane protein
MPLDAPVQSARSALPVMAPPVRASLADRPHALFLLLGSLFAALLLFLTPPFQVPDEPAHFLRAYQVSELGVFAHRPRGQGPNRVHFGGRLPRSLLAVFVKVSADVPGHREHKQDLTQLLVSLHTPLRPEEREFIGFDNTARYPPILYLPQAIGIRFARALGASALLILYAGRLGSVAAWLLCGYWTLRIIPIGRWFVFALLLMPMSIFEAASLSADVVTNSLTFLFIAFIIGWALDPTLRIGVGRLAVLVVLGALVALCKAVYTPVVLLILMIPRPRFLSGSRRAYWLSCAVVIAISFAACIAWWLPATLHSVPIREGDIDGHRQLLFILHHPVQFLSMNVRSLEPTYLGATIGNLGWLDTPMGRPFLSCYAALLLLAALAEGHKQICVGLWPRCLAAACALIAWLAVDTASYLTWTPVGAPRIEGLQGRYLIPFLPLGALLLYNRCLADYTKRHWSLFMMVCTAASCLYTVHMIIRRYYIA